MIMMIVGQFDPHTFMFLFFLNNHFPTNKCIFLFNLLKYFVKTKMAKIYILNVMYILFR